MVALAKRKQDEFQAFFTNCNYITSYMISLLQCNEKMTVLEPCAGDGVFVDGLMENNSHSDITAYELNSDSIETLNEKFSSSVNVKVEQKDFLILGSSYNKKFDRVIANPPYGAYLSLEKRKVLKKDYPHIYAKETYGLFLIKSLELLKNNGRLVFIIPDTYLTLHMHEGLRSEILKNYTIESISLFPSKFFPGVNFGYAGLSIISIVNKKPNNDYKFPVYNGLDESKELLNLLTNKRKKYEICSLSYKHLLDNSSCAFFLPSKEWISLALSKKILKIGDICSVVTGFYSGNDGKYLRRSESITRGIKKYAVINKNEVFEDDLSKSPPLDGLNMSRYWVPIVKGGNKRFYKKSEWFMDWSKESIHDYKVVNKKRARFQNSQYYFHQGIGVPMVSSTSITGSLIDGRLFDQSIVGIFPHEEHKHLTHFLLGFFNSSICNDLIRTINASTNNSSNYIKKIPIIIPNDEIVKKIVSEVKKLILLSKKGDINNADLRKLNEYFEKIYIP